MSVCKFERESESENEGGIGGKIAVCRRFKQGIFPSDTYCLFHNKTFKGNINRQNLHWQEILNLRKRGNSLVVLCDMPAASFHWPLCVCHHRPRKTLFRIIERALVFWIR